MRLTRAELRERFAELREIINGWDPIGVLRTPDGPSDEYECVVGPLMRQLEDGAPVAVVAQYLSEEFTGHFGLSIPEERIQAWAAQAKDWYSARWPATESVPRPDAV